MRATSSENVPVVPNPVVVTLNQVMTRVFLAQAKPAPVLLLVVQHKDMRLGWKCLGSDLLDFYFLGKNTFAMVERVVGQDTPYTEK